MPRYLLASTALFALAAGAHSARAEDITTKKTTPLRTSTIKDGAADAIHITKDGSVVLTGGTAVTMDSNHAVTNAGALTVSNGSAGPLPSADPHRNTRTEHGRVRKERA